MRRCVGITALAALAGFAACASAPRESEAEPPAPPASMAADVRGGVAVPVAVVGRKLVRTAHLELWVVDYDRARPALDAIVSREGGFVSDTDLTVRDDGRRASLTLRVPADHLDGVLGALRGLGKVRHESVGTEDVTRQFVDTDARLRNLSRTEARMLELLGHAGGNLAEILEVERELTRVRGEIETTTAQLNALDERVALATVNVSLVEESEEIVNEPDDLFASVRQLRKSAGAMLLQSFGVLVNVAVAAIIVLLYLLPWIGLASVVILLKPSWRRGVARWWRRRRGAPPATS